ncbi:MAG: alpha/beta fold hydrolase [Calditrichaeota bacterium]|nr:MAG: alpha/beta fold hydrolase [Calditrichota bacterium]
MIKRKYCILLLFFLLGSITIYVGLYHIAPYAILKPRRYIASEHLDSFPNGITPDGYGLRFSRLEIPVDKGVVIKGWYIFSSGDTTLGTILMLHGVASCKEHLLRTAQWLSKEGFNVITYDSRAHGESGGEFCTYGFYESRDVTIVLDSVLHQFPDAPPIAIWGNSMGGAIALLAMSQDHRIQCGVIESPFASLEEVAYLYMKRLTKIPFRWVSQLVLQRAADIAHFSPEAVSPVDAARNIYAPTLIVHGTADRNIPMSHGKRIFDNLSSPIKEWYPVDGGTHYHLWRTAGESYPQKILAFFKEALHQGI